ncbi:uncharacterized, partial [Tachysurus ichikawai]
MTPSRRIKEECIDSEQRSLRACWEKVNISEELQKSQTLQRSSELVSSDRDQDGDVSGAEWDDFTAGLSNVQVATGMLQWQWSGPPLKWCIAPSQLWSGNVALGSVERIVMK